MMKGVLRKLSERLDTDILAFREHRSKPCFYAPNIENIIEEKGFKSEKDGVFTNFYPDQSMQNSRHLPAAVCIPRQVLRALRQEGR